MMSVPALGLLCVLLLVLAAPLLLVDPTTWLVPGQRSSAGAFAARRVTIREFTLHSDPGITEVCMFVADLESTSAGWTLFLSRSHNRSYQGLPGGGSSDAGDELDALTSAAMRALMAIREPKSSDSIVVETTPSGGLVKLELTEGQVELLVTHPAHRPVRARMQHGSRVRELYFRADLVEDLPAHTEKGDPPIDDDCKSPPRVMSQEGALCRWAHKELDEVPRPAPPRERRGKRQTEIVVINQRKKHHGGSNAAAVAIGLGVGLGVGIPVVVLLALIPCLIALWLIRKRRRGSRTIRVADVPTGVFATGQAVAANPTYQEEEPSYQESDLQSTLGENY